MATANQTEQPVEAIAQSPVSAKVLVNSLPKSGTNLLASILDCTPGVQFQRVILNRNLRWHPFNYLPFGDRRTCFAGVDQPAKVTLGAVRQVLSKLQPGCYTSAHMPYNAGVEDILAKFNIRPFFVIRDPRDVVVSGAKHAMQHTGHFLHEEYKRLPSDKARLLAAIRGIQRADGSFLGSDMAAKLRSIEGWLNAPSVVTLKFEDMIGAQGGGSDGTQQAAILKVGEHIGLPLTPPMALDIGHRAFGRGNTFRAGQIGSWRQSFDDEVKAIFKQEAGALLIKMGYEQNDDW